MGFDGGRFLGEVMGCSMVWFSRVDLRDGFNSYASLSVSALDALHLIPPLTLFPHT